MADRYEIEIEVSAEGAAALESINGTAGAIEKDFAAINRRLGEMFERISAIGAKMAEMGVEWTAGAAGVLWYGIEMADTLNTTEALGRTRPALTRFLEKPEDVGGLQTALSALSADVGPAKIREWASGLREFTDEVIRFGDQLETKVVPNLKTFLDLVSEFEGPAEPWSTKLPLITEDDAEFEKEIGKIGLKVAPYYKKLRDEGTTAPTDTGIWEWIERVGAIASILGFVLTALGLVLTAFAIFTIGWEAAVIIIASFIYMLQVIGFLVAAAYTLYWAYKSNFLGIQTAVRGAAAVLQFFVGLNMYAYEVVVRVWRAIVPLIDKVGDAFIALNKKIIDFLIKPLEMFFSAMGAIYEAAPESIKKSLGDAGKWIEGVRRKGYMTIGFGPEPALIGQQGTGFNEELFKWSPELMGAKSKGGGLAAGQQGGLSPKDLAYTGGGVPAGVYGGESGTGGAGRAITIYQTIEKVDINTTEKVDADSLLEVARTLIKTEADTLS